MSIVEIGRDARRRTPPEDAARELHEAFGGELFYEWLPNSRRWAVMRRVPWGEVERLFAAGSLTEADLIAHLEYRHAMGAEDVGDALIVHAFTVQDPRTGERVEPGSWVIEALRAADTQQLPGGARAAAHAVLERQREREAKLDAWYRDQIEQASEHFDPWLRQLPRMSYPTNPLAGESRKETSDGGD